MVEDVWNQSRHEPASARASLLQIIHGASPGLDSSLEGESHQGGDAWPQAAGGAPQDLGRVELMRADIEDERAARQARGDGSQRARQQSEAARTTAHGQPSFLHQKHQHQPHAASPVRAAPGGAGMGQARAAQDPLQMLQDDFPNLDAFVVEQVRGLGERNPRGVTRVLL